jgi:hypothetical protein
MSFVLVDWLSFGALIVYTYLTYLILKEKYKSLVSFYLNGLKEKSHIGFNMDNMSEVEVEVFGIVWVKINNKLFEFKDGFYGNKKHWILQPKTKVFGNFYLNNLEDERGIKIEDFLRENKKNSISFNVEIKYKRILKNKFLRRFWKIKGKKTSPQKYFHNFDNGDFWLDV